MSDTVNESRTRTIPPTPRHMRTLAIFASIFLLLRSLRFWREHADPMQSLFIRKYISASIWPSQHKRYELLYATVYHEPVWKVLLPLLIVDGLLLIALYSVAYWLDYRKIRELRRGIRIAGPRLYRKVTDFQRAVWKA